MSRSASRWLLTASLIGCSLLASCQCPKVRLVGVGKDRAPSQTSRLLRVRVLLLSAHGADQFRRSSFEQLWPAWKDSAANADAFSVPGLDESKGEQAILERRELRIELGAEDSLRQSVALPADWCDREQAVSVGFLTNPPPDLEIDNERCKLLVDKSRLTAKTEISVSDEGLILRPRGVSKPAAEVVR